MLIASRHAPETSGWPLAISTPEPLNGGGASPGKQIVFDRLRENSDIVLIDLPQMGK
jgi:hypothetical protein